MNLFLGHDTRIDLALLFYTEHSAVMSSRDEKELIFSITNV